MKERFTGRKKDGPVHVYVDMSMPWSASGSCLHVSVSVFLLLHVCSFFWWTAFLTGLHLYCGLVYYIGESALEYALHRGKWAISALLLHKGNADVDAEDENGTSSKPVIESASHGNSWGIVSNCVCSCVVKAGLAYGYILLDCAFSTASSIDR